MSLIDLLLSLVVLAPMGLLGVAVLWRARLGLEPVELVAYGIPFGWAVGSILSLLAATPAGLSARLVVLGSVVFVALALIVATPADSAVLPSTARPARRGGDPLGLVQWGRWGSAVQAWWVRFGDWRPIAGLTTGLTRSAPLLARRAWLPTVVFLLMAIPWVRFWSYAVTYDADGIAFGHIFLFYDWPLHLGDLSSILYGHNLPMDNPRYAGSPYPYHYLATYTAAMIASLGVEPGYALALHSLFATFTIALAVYAFARRLLRRTSTATLAMFAFFHMGNLSWLLTAQRIDAGGNFWHTLIWRPWGFDEFEKQPYFTFLTMFIYPFISQRAWTYGWPLFLLVVVLVYLGVTRDSRRAFVAAGLCVGLLPLANLSSLLGLGLTLPFVAILFPRPGRGWSLRRYPILNWALFAAIGTVAALPTLLGQRSDGGAISAIRWDATGFTDDSFAAITWYWLKNLGLVPVFVIAALLMRGSLTSGPRRLLLAFMPLFLLANVVAFQPFASDNPKLVSIWLLAACVAFAAGIATLWRDNRSIAVRFVLSLLVATTVLGGVLVDIGLVTWHQRVGIASLEEVELAADVRAGTDPHALFATSQRSNAPILMLAGRPTFLGNGAQLAAHGYDLGPYEADLRSIMALDDDMPDLIARYGIDYVVIGFAERDDFDVDEAGYLARYPVAFESERYRIFAVSDEARRRLRVEQP